MKSRLASVRAAGGLDRVDGAVQLLEDEWQQHGEVQLRQFWNQPRCRAAVDPGDAIDVLAELVKADLRCRFERGQTPAVADYLEQFPELRAADSRVLSLVYEEYCLNEERGNAPDLDSFCERYPDWKSSLVSQLQYHRLFSQAAGGRPSLPHFPEAGQDFEEFRLQSLLGSGGMSRVFLAKDLSLGGKQVVLKVTLDRGQEPKVQGSLDHPHIVPVNSVVYQADGDLCGLSMPYRPGLPLDEVIARLDLAAKRPRKAIALWHALTSGMLESSRRSAIEKPGRDQQINEMPHAPRGDGWEGFPTRGTYAQGVAWTMMILARALDYAHRKRTYHRDVKPGNVLLTLDHGLQLLDFNLAESPHSGDHARAALHGGTLPYMAPEQIEAFINPDLWNTVEAKADIYSLGLVFRELLTGQKPDVPDPTVQPARALRATLDRRSFLDTSVRRFDRAIPHALEAIVAKCLCLSPNDRYTDADALAQDLDRFLHSQPLIHVVNSSRRERVRNWMTRQRRVICVAACLLVACALYGVVEALIPPPIEATPAFASAVRFFDTGGSATKAVEKFRALEAIGAHSPLVKFYLAFTLKASEKPDDPVKRYNEAEQCLRDALAAPDAEKSAVAWSKDHIKFDAYLVDLADSSIQRADNAAARYDDGTTEADEERDRVLRQPTYEMAMEALRLAEKLNPGHPKTQRLLATTEEFFDEHSTAYERLSRIINSFNPGSENDMLFFTHQLRVWVALTWAEQEQEAGRASSEIRARLCEVRKDSEYCARYLSKWAFSDQVRKRYFVMEHGLRATVVLAEIELHLSMLDNAKTHLAEGEQSLRRVNAYIESEKLKVAKTTRLEERLALVRAHLDKKRTPSDLAAIGPHPH